MDLLTNFASRKTGERHIFLLLLLTALGLSWLAMAPCAENGFVNWDEQVYILDNPRVKELSLNSVKAAFTTSDMGMYSPLSTLSHALNYHFSGTAPEAYHATDLALHLCNTALVMVLARLLFPGIWTAFLTALLFGIHPAHVESVAWAAERKDLLYSFFYLAALAVHAARFRGGKGYLASLGLFVCALFSKPMAVTFPAAMLLVDYLKSEKVSRRQWLEKIPFFAAAGAFILLQLSAGGMEMHWLKRLVVPLYNLGFYLYTLAWPFNLSAMYVAAPWGRAGIALFAALAVAAGLALWKYARRDKEVVFGAAFFTLTLLPVLQFFPFGPVISADRYTYLSSIGIFGAAAVLGRRLWLRTGPLQRRALAVCAACAVLTLAVTARVRCGVWKDGLSLWSDTVRKQPAAGPALANLCGAYLKAGLRRDAEACLSLGLRTDPGRVENHCNMCYLLYSLGRYDEAESYCLSALRIEPRYANAVNKLGDIYLAKGETEKARQHYGWTILCDRNHPSAYRSLGELALKRGEKDTAAMFFGKALEVDPSDGKARKALEAIKNSR